MAPELAPGTSMSSDQGMTFAIHSLDCVPYATCTHASKRMYSLAHDFCLVWRGLHCPNMHTYVHDRGSTDAHQLVVGQPLNCAQWGDCPSVRCRYRYLEGLTSASVHCTTCTVHTLWDPQSSFASSLHKPSRMNVYTFYTYIRNILPKNSTNLFGTLEASIGFRSMHYIVVNIYVS